MPVAAERVRVLADGDVIDLAGRALSCMDTPGHARHHLCVWDERSRSWFTGDTFGLSYREFDNAAAAPFVIPTTSPVQFEPEPLKASIRAMLARAPESMYLTHYGRVGDVARLARRSHRADRRDGRTGARCARPRRPPCAPARIADPTVPVDAPVPMAPRWVPSMWPELLAIDIELNAQGLEVWLDRDRG